jgi:hypothetical protein
MTITGHNGKVKIITCPATKLTSSTNEQIITNEDDIQIKSKTSKKFKST